MIVRINDVGRAEAIDYRNFQYRPQEAENKYYLTRWAELYFARNRFTIERDQTNALYFLNSDVQRAVIEQERKDNIIRPIVRDSTLPYRRCRGQECRPRRPPPVALFGARRVRESLHQSGGSYRTEARALDGQRHLRLPRQREEQRAGGQPSRIDHRPLPGRPGVRVDEATPITRRFMSIRDHKSRQLRPSFLRRRHERIHHGRETVWPVACKPSLQRRQGDRFRVRERRLASRECLCAMRAHEALVSRFYPLFVRSHASGHIRRPAARRRSAFRTPLPKRVWAPAPECAAWHLGAGLLAQASPMGDPANPGIQHRRLHHVSEPHFAHRIPRPRRHHPHRQQRQLHRSLACHQEFVQGQEDRRIQRPYRVASLHRLGQAWPSTRRRSRRARIWPSKASCAAASAWTRRPTPSSAYGKCAWLRS